MNAFARFLAAGIALAAQAGFGQTAPRQNFHLSCNLDFLLEYPKAWSLTPEDLDRQFDKAGFEKNPYFEWLSSSKDRARFSRKPFSNVTVVLRLFGEKVMAEEVTVDFKEGRLSLVNVSLYNRGDSGMMGAAEFDALFKTCGQQLGLLTKSTARQQPADPGRAVKSVGWMWNSPLAVALMEHNELKGKGGSVIQPEYLRVKIGSPGSKGWVFNQMPSGLLTRRVGKADLVENVTKTAEGDVYIKNVPMVDQGPKGYCVAASCQRLFEYYQLPADQHEFAQLFGTTATGGTSSREMEAALDKVDSRFKTRFKPLYNTAMKYDRNGKPLTSAKLLDLVKDHASRGVPLLWALEIGIMPETPPLGGAAQGNSGLGAQQIRGGHMRLIIGCNEKSGEVLFSDSWGSGHELKRMSMDGAAQVTDGIYLLEPRG